MKKKSNFIWLYDLIYFIIGFIKSYSFKEVNLYSIILILFGVWLLHGGVKSIKTKKAWIRGAPTSKNSATGIGISLIIIAIIILMII